MVILTQYSPANMVVCMASPENILIYHRGQVYAIPVPQDLYLIKQGLCLHYADSDDLVIDDIDSYIDSISSLNSEFSSSDSSDSSSSSFNSDFGPKKWKISNVTGRFRVGFEDNVNGSNCSFEQFVQALETSKEVYVTQDGFVTDSGTYITSSYAVVRKNIVFVPMEMSEICDTSGIGPNRTYILPCGKAVVANIDICGEYFLYPRIERDTDENSGNPPFPNIDHYIHHTPNPTAAVLQ